MSFVTGQKAHGQKGAVYIQGYAATAAAEPTLLVLAVKKWDGDLKWKEHDTSNTSIIGWDTFQKGKAHLEFSIDAELDLTQNPLGATTGVNLQTDYCGVNLIADQTQGTPGYSIFNCPVAIVSGIKITAAENDIIKYTITGKSSGAVILNQGS